MCGTRAQLLIDRIEDERRMFAGARLTRAERDQMAFNETVLKLANEIKGSFDAGKEDVYAMPQSYERDGAGLTERQALLKARFQCAPRPPCGGVWSWGDGPEKMCYFSGMRRPRTRARRGVSRRSWSRRFWRARASRAARRRRRRRTPTRQSSTPLWRTTTSTLW